jgi:hypothetical protein
MGILGIQRHIAELRTARESAALDASLATPRRFHDHDRFWPGPEVPTAARRVRLLR